MDSEYTTPEFLENSEVDEIHKRMLGVIPESFDKSDGGFIHDLTKPTAIEISRLKQFSMNEAIKQIFPIFASGEFLDRHGKVRNLPRKDGIAATGELTITGDKGTVIKEGDMFCTESINGIPSVLYSATKTYTIPESGSIIITIACNEVGLVGNTAANTIILKYTQNNGIKSVTNKDPITGGIAAEEDIDYRARILEYDRESDVSYVGSITDYKRWANQVDGVGSVTVIPAQDDSGTVTIVLTDGNGDPASEELCTAVYNHIMRPDSPVDRLTAPNAIPVVIPSEITPITVSATVKLENSTIDEVKTALLKSLKEYFALSIDDLEIRYMQVCSIINETPGIYDVSNVTINGQTANITITKDKNPRITEDSLTLIDETIE